MYVSRRFILFTAVSITLSSQLLSCAKSRAVSAHPTIDTVMTAMVAKNEISGAVTLVANKDQVLHLSAVGLAQREAKIPMKTDAMMWIASMTKPITGVAIMMLHDQGKLSLDDSVKKYIPEFAQLKTLDGTHHDITIRQLMNHTSGLAESTPDERDAAHNLADLIPGFTQRPLVFVPGSRWLYCQSGFTTLGRIIEMVSGVDYPSFLQENIFNPLGMVDTTFYPDPVQQARLATVYRKDSYTLVPDNLPKDYQPTNVGHYPAPNGGLFSTASDYATFCRMLLNNGSLHGRTYLQPSSVEKLRTISTGELKTGFIDGSAWGLTMCVVKTPQGASGTLSPGSFGHGGAYGTQAWIDPHKERIYILFVQRQNFSNSDSSDVRRVFQAAAQGVR
jgi:CubicO group peptidase (beta-lactamase class C family)